ncbi:Signal peptidase I OS=Cellulomonas persica OX=76861 GN=CPE01_00280 PE=3 SV=1 [Cellulomonas persica]|uniref:Signal peptidase I n=1 Tax=Cellulomonas persica TaxID=76861 RepID=A0A510UTZ8_9CELL|nr:hypothetical protein CPE01_00280 [Cellulomonas persica]
MRHVHSLACESYPVTSRADDDPARTQGGPPSGSTGEQGRAEVGGAAPYSETERDSMHETSAGTWPAEPTLTPDPAGEAEPATPEAPATRSQRRDAERGGRRRRRSAGGSILRETAIILVSALVLSWLIKTLLVQAFFIPSSSMHDTLVEDDRIMVSKLTPGPFDLERGDIIVFKDPGGWLEGQKPVEATGWRGAMNDLFTFVGLYPQDAGEHLVKRVIGLPGDRVACAGPGEPVTVNGVELDEPYLAAGAIPSQMAFDVTVPPDSLWVMGDNRQRSSDSRLHQGDPGGGAIPMDNVVGKAFVLVWPIDRATVLHNPGDTFKDVPDPS